MLARPGVERGRHVPSPHQMKEMSKEEMEKMAHEGAKCTYYRHLLSRFPISIHQCRSWIPNIIREGTTNAFLLPEILMSDRWTHCLGGKIADGEICTGIQREQAKDAQRS